ncbi:MAG: protein kinase domain-containing protein, partial [Nannocystaceae bacterium]
MSQNRSVAFPNLEEAQLEIHEELGRGSFSRVYRGVRRGLDYAVKIQTGHGDPAHRRHFLREAAALACFDDPGLAKIHTIGEQDGRAYLVMDLIEGASLADVLRQGPLPEARIVELARRIARALHVAHRHGVVHCDVKPRNIIVGDTPEIKLVDFGLAARKQELRQGRVVMGTYIYSAPEQTGLLRRTVDGRADLYALGVVMFACASGRTPFVTNDPDEMMQMHASVVPPDVRTLAPGVSWGLSAVITKLLAKDPDDRFQTGMELVEALNALPALNSAAAHGQPLRLDRHVRRFAGRDLDLPLIGRDDEMAAIERRWQRARAGEGSVVWMQGRPGSGKSRLLREIVARLDRGQARVFLVTCPQDRSGPFTPLRAVVEALHRDISRGVESERRLAIAELKRAAGDRAGLLARFSDLLRLYLGTPSAEATDDLLFGAVADFITALATPDRPLVLMIDDVQWLDTASIQVLRRLLVSVEQHPILLVMGSRTEADAGNLLTPYDASGASMLRILLNPLTVGDVRALVGVLIGGPLRPRIVEQITSRTG